MTTAITSSHQPATAEDLTPQAIRVVAWLDPVIDNAAAGLKMLQVLRSLQQSSGLSKSEIGPFRALPEEGVRLASAALHSIDVR